MTIRTSLAGFATAFVLGAGALLGGTLATSSAAEAAPGWHGGYGGHGHFRHDFRHPGRAWSRGGWGYRPIYTGGYYPRCFTVLRARFVPGLGMVERPVTRCR